MLSDDACCKKCPHQKNIEFVKVNFPQEELSFICSSCPLVFNNTPKEDSDQICASCSSSLQSIKMLEQVGCIDCLSTFDDELQGLLHRMILDVLSDVPQSKFPPFHIGRKPSKKTSKHEKLIHLKKELEIAIQKEHFEQAAWLKSQIDHLSEESC